MLLSISSSHQVSPPLLCILLLLLLSIGGRGGDDKLTCLDSKGKVQPRCPQFNNYVTGNDGLSFQTGCGYDPFDTGCCIDSLNDPNPSKQRIQCYKCDEAEKVIIDNTFIRKLNDNELKLLCGFPLSYKLPNDVNKYDLFGNMVIPNVVEGVLKCIFQL